MFFADISNVSRWQSTRYLPSALSGVLDFAGRPCFFAPSLSFLISPFSRRIRQGNRADPPRRVLPRRRGPDPSARRVRWSMSASRRPIKAPSPAPSGANPGIAGIPGEARLDVTRTANPAWPTRLVEPLGEWPSSSIGPGAPPCSSCSKFAWPKPPMDRFHQAGDALFAKRKRIESARRDARTGRFGGRGGHPP